MKRSLRQLLLALAAGLSLIACNGTNDGGGQHRGTTPPVATHTLTIVASGTGTTDPPAGTHTFVPGTSVKVTASAGWGAAFTGWSGDAAGTDESVTVTMDTDRTVTASFGPGDYGVVVNSIAGLTPDFIMGADVSMLKQIEVSGGKFYDESGTQADCLQILKSHGVNWVRLRLWNDPVLAHGFTPETGVNVLAGESAAGINDLARDIELARRAKALGMKVLLDFHYSDWWADPGKQFVPQAWEGMTLDQLKAALHAFTGNAVSQMRAQGAGPDMVQLGNEVTNGMLWPLGWVDNHASTFGSFSALLAEGSKAVREVDPTIPILIHIDKGGDNALYRRFFSALVADAVDFDVIGLSYYPSWHGTMAALQANLADISQLFGKPVAIAETAYPWTTENADGQSNNVDGQAMLTAGPYLPTVQGQATFVRDLTAIVAGVPDGRGLGIFYWEPDWIAVAGAGWYTQGGDGWDNQTFFDHDGKALPSLSVFRAVTEDRPVVEATPVRVTPQAGIATLTGQVPTLPTTVNVVFSDDSFRALDVVWDAVDPSVWNTIGSFDLGGTIPGTSLTVALPVTVSYMANPGFEDGTTGWTVTDPSRATSISGSDVRSGTHVLHWWLGAAFNYTVQQTVSGLEAGKTYAFSFWTMGASGEPMHAFATCGASTQTLDFTLAGWASNPNAWLHETIGNLDGAAGSCTVGVSSAGRAGDWGSLDDFAFSEQ